MQQLRSRLVEPTQGYNTFSLSTKGNITRVLIDNPPINLLDYNMLVDFRKLLTNLQDDPNASKVVIFASADPTFFVAHLDLHILSFHHPPPPPQTNDELINLYGNVTEQIRSSPSILIAEVSGKGTAAGNELLVQMDMRFASTGASLGAAEVALGLTHAAGGLQHLVRLIGPEGHSSICSRWTRRMRNAWRRLGG